MNEYNPIPEPIHDAISYVEKESALTAYQQLDPDDPTKILYIDLLAEGRQLPSLRIYPPESNNQVSIIFQNANLKEVYLEHFTEEASHTIDPNGAALQIESIVCPDFRNLSLKEIRQQVNRQK